ncbi:transposase [Streptomyces sp. NPDC059455]|uniref:transposase n=1 Tax=Streptomyces sp. NPDC059455 TaxID=3346837 RepID=UPI0036C2F238
MSDHLLAIKRPAPPRTRCDICGSCGGCGCHRRGWAGRAKTQERLKPRLRESTEHRVDLLCDCHRHGMRDPERVVGNCAMGLRKASAEVFPIARHQRCRVHKAKNITDSLRKSAQPGVMQVRKSADIQAGTGTSR